MTFKKNPDWLNKGYNTTICSSLHLTVFEYFIKNDRIDKYNLMCYITAHDKQQPKYLYDTSSGGGREIP